MVVNLKSPSVPGSPSGAQGASGVSNTGQGIPNVSKKNGGTTSVIPPIDATNPNALPAQYYIANQPTVGNPSPNTVTPSYNPTTADFKRTEYQSVQDPYRGGRWETMQANQGYPSTPVPSLSQSPVYSAQWRSSIDSGFAQTVQDKWAKMIAESQSPLFNGRFSNDLTADELAWLKKFGRPSDIAYYNYFHQGGGILSPDEVANMLGGSGGGSSSSSEDSYSNGGYDYKSSAASYGLVNWRL